MNCSLTTRALILALTFVLCGAPELIAQSAQALPDAPSATRLLAQNTAPPQQDPSAVPTDSQVEQQRQQSQDQAAPQQPRVVPVEPAKATGTEDEQQQPDAAAAPTTNTRREPQLITPADPAELQKLDAVQQQNEPQAAPANERANPLGTAAAEKGQTAGGGASRPAGVAIAPAKQKRSRSLLIKLGAIAAAGAAIGTVYALSKGTSSTPPGAVR
jgi:hypothetical protein